MNQKYYLLKSILKKFNFKGPKLPDSVTRPSYADLDKIRMGYLKKEDETTAALNSELATSPSTRSPGVSQENFSTVPTIDSMNEANADSGDPPNGPKINYTKDELAKYDDLSKMSQMYAKINQVKVLHFGPNGAEINMVELDNSSAPFGAVQLEPNNQHLLIANSVNTFNQSQQQIHLLESQILETSEQMQEQQQQHEKQMQTYQQEQQKSVLQFHLQQQQQQREIQLQLQHLQQSGLRLTANPHLQQFNVIHNFHAIEAQHHKQQLINLQLDQLKQQQQHLMQAAQPLALIQIADKPEPLQIGELNQMTVPDDIKILTSPLQAAQPEVVTSSESPEAQQITELVTTSPPAQEVISNEQPVVDEQQTSNLPESEEGSSTSTQAVVEGNPVEADTLFQANAGSTITNPASILQVQPQQQQQPQRIQYQPIQYLQAGNLMQIGGNAATSQHLANLQQLHLNQQHIQFGQQFLTAQFEPGLNLNQHLTVINAQQLAAIQQQQHMQAQQAAALQVIQQNQQQHMQLPLYHFQHAPAIQLANPAQFAQPQFIQLRPNPIASAFQGLAAPAQPQFIVNSPFYRILPQ